MKHIYTSVDIGTDTTKVVVTELYKGKLNFSDITARCILCRSSKPCISL